MHSLALRRSRQDLICTIYSHFSVAANSRLAGESLRRLWNDLDQTQQCAVSEVLYDPVGEFHREMFEAKYGMLSAGFGPVGTLEASPLRLFLYPASRYDAEPFGIPSDLANRLRAFVPPPAEATLVAEDELPQSVDIPRHAWLRKDETPTFDRVELVRRDMESAAPRDLQSVLRLIDRGRIAVSAKTRRASTTAVQRIVEVLDGGDFFDPAEKKERWEQTIGPIRAFAWPWLVQAGKLAECRGSKLALTKAGHAALGAPAAPALRRLWQRWIRAQVASGEYGNDSEYFRDLIRRDQERNAQFRALKQAIQDGLESGVGDKTVREIWAEAEQRYGARHG